MYTYKNFGPRSQIWLRSHRPGNPDIHCVYVNPLILDNQALEFSISVRYIQTLLSSEYNILISINSEMRVHALMREKYVLVLIFVSYCTFNLYS